MTDWTPEKLDTLVEKLNSNPLWPAYTPVFKQAAEAITALRAQLAETDALIAAAYEAAAEAINKRGAVEQRNFGLGRETQNFYRARDLVRALTPSTARDAYSAAIAAAERAGYEAGLQAAAHWIECVPGSLPNRQEYAAHIRSLSAKKGSPQ